MLFTEQMYYNEEEYEILLREKDNLLMNFVNEQKSVWNSYFGKVKAQYEMLDRRLFGVSFAFAGNLMKKEETLLEMEPEINEETNEVIYRDLDVPIDYTGGIVIGREFVSDFGLTGEYPCYCYRYVYELIFENGKLVTNIDHSRSMLRIRKNLEKGLRTTDDKKDMRCINRFLTSVLYKKYNKYTRKRMFKKKMYEYMGN